MSGGVIATLRKLQGMVVIERKKQFGNVAVNGKAVKQAQLRKGDTLTLGNGSFTIGTGTKFPAES